MAPLLDCTIEELWTVIGLLWSEGIKTHEIFRRMLAQYGEHCIAKKSVYKWVDRFKSGRTTLDEG